MKSRLAAAIAARWFGVIILVILPAISSIGGALLVFPECFHGGVKGDDLALLIVSVITLAIGLAVCFRPYRVSSDESAASQR
jgi:hypothetical protein